MVSDLLTLLLLLITFLTDATQEVSPWTEWSKCSRSCGGGVQVRTRATNRKSKGLRNAPFLGVTDLQEYRLCNLNDCPVGSATFRSFQCSAYNNRQVAGRTNRKWIPVRDHWGCELKCQSSNFGNIIYSFGKAQNGTSCSPGKSPRSVCLHGRCTSVGCDYRLGSNTTVDICGACGGRNDTCHLVRDAFHGPRQPSAYGLEFVVKFPSGSTNIRVQDSTTSRLVIRDTAGRSLLNGNKRYSWPGRYSVAGSDLQYRFTWNNETVEIIGPTNQDLDLMVKYGYPLETNVVYQFWRPSMTTTSPVATTSTNHVQRLRKKKNKRRHRKSDHLISSGRNQTKARDELFDNKKHRKTKKKKLTSEHCQPCKKVKNLLQHFCDSHFVINAKVKGYQVVNGEFRYELHLLQSYKNLVGLGHREFVWTPDECRCPRLRPHRHYVIMGHVDPAFSKRESRLVVDRNSFVRRLTDRRETDLLRAARNQARHCNRII